MRFWSFIFWLEGVVSKVAGGLGHEYNSDDQNDQNYMGYAYQYSDDDGFKHGLVDGIGADARFFQPAGVSVDSTGNVWVVDEGNYMIRKINTAGMFYVKLLRFRI